VKVSDVPYPEASFDRVPPAVRAKATQHLKSLGWKPTNRVGRIQVGRRPHRKQGGAIVTVQDGTVSSSEGEITTWDWDDDNPETTEGEIYLYDYALGEEVLIYVQYDIHDTYDPIPLASGSIWADNDEIGWDSIAFRRRDGDPGRARPRVMRDRIVGSQPRAA
jgi:hypothetical protein